MDESCLFQFILRHEFTQYLTKIHLTYTHSNIWTIRNLEKTTVAKSL